ncbi:MAG: hypothetical protein JW993_10920 [Sedimentisphaerales bacterium]|nr:hypothetical protein [Sedimentisphaerales bacterium]
MRTVLVLLGCLFTPSLAWKQPLMVYPAPEGVASRDSFTVNVRTPAGQWQELFCYEVQVDMHHPRPSSLAYFDFSGQVEVSATYNRGEIRSARIRPLSYGITPRVDGNVLTFTLTQPRNLSVEVNDDIFDNLHLFAGPIETDRPDPNDPNVIHFGPGVHSPGRTLRVSSGKTVYLAGGAVVKTKLLCNQVENVRIIGRGLLYQPERGVEVTFSKNVAIGGITVINPTHYTVYGGQSQNITIRNLKAFSSRGWSDGIDLMSCSDVLVDGVFMRNSDDCIAIYGHRWDYYGDARNITVRNSSLWADVAHPVNLGTHGNPETPEVLEDITFANIDILNHDEPQINYQGCIAMNASDENLIRNVRVENVRIEDFEQGQLVNLRVTFNKKYATAPGRGIENILFKDVTYNGRNANLSVIAGYNEQRATRNVAFEGLRINGELVWDRMPGKPGYFATSDVARIFVGEHVEGLEFRAGADSPMNP